MAASTSLSSTGDPLERTVDTSGCGDDGDGDCRCCAAPEGFTVCETLDATPQPFESSSSTYSEHLTEVIIF
jgi:hypothetical protein